MTKMLRIPSTMIQKQPVYKKEKKRGDVDSCFDPSPILFLFVTMGAATF